MKTVQVRLSWGVRRLWPASRLGSSLGLEKPLQERTCHKRVFHVGYPRDPLQLPLRGFGPLFRRASGRELSLAEKITQQASSSSAGLLTSGSTFTISLMALSKPLRPTW